MLHFVSFLESLRTVDNITSHPRLLSWYFQSLPRKEVCALVSLLLQREGLPKLSVTALKKIALANAEIGERLAALCFEEVGEICEASAILLCAKHSQILDIPTVTDALTLLSSWEKEALATAWEQALTTHLPQISIRHGEFLLRLLCHRFKHPLGAKSIAEALATVYQVSFFEAYTCVTSPQFSESALAKLLSEQHSRGASPLDFNPAWAPLRVRSHDELLQHPGVTAVCEPLTGDYYQVILCAGQVAIWSIDGRFCNEEFSALVDYFRLIKTEDSLIDVFISRVSGPHSSPIDNDRTDDDGSRSVVIICAQFRIVDGKLALISEDDSQNILDLFQQASDIELRLPQRNSLHSPQDWSVVLPASKGPLLLYHGLTGPLRSLYLPQFQQFRLATLIILYAKKGSYDAQLTITLGAKSGEGFVSVGTIELQPSSAYYHPIDRWISVHTVEKFGPVRKVPPTYALTVSFSHVTILKRGKSRLKLENVAILAEPIEGSNPQIHTYEELSKTVNNERTNYSLLYDISNVSR